MSDGPHRSLPMSRAWKKFTECVNNEAFRYEEVRDAIVAALEQDWRKQNMGSLVRRVHEALSDGQADLFYEQRAERLDLIRREAASSQLQCVFFHFLDKAMVEGLSGDGAIIKVACQTLSDLESRRTRQVEEHCLRTPGQKLATDVRQRIEGTIKGLDIAAVARHLLGIGKGKAESPRVLAKRKGLDDGVRL